MYRMVVTTTGLVYDQVYVATSVIWASFLGRLFQTQNQRDFRLTYVLKFMTNSIKIYMYLILINEYKFHLIKIRN